MISKRINIFNAFVFLLFSFQAMGQDNKNFILNGVIENSEASAIGVAIGFINSDFSNYHVEEGVNKIVDNKFRIEGEFAYPHAFRFVTDTGDISGIFFLDPTDQSVYIKALDSRNFPEIKNSKTSHEYHNKYLPLVQSLITKDNFLYTAAMESSSDEEIKDVIKERQKVRSKKNGILLQYIKDNPDSYVGMWLFTEDFSIYGYNLIYDEMYNHLSDTLKNTFVGKALYKKLEENRRFSANGYFPEASLLKYNGTETKLAFNSLDTDFLLIDFWATWCAPCLKQFPEIVDLYKTTSRDFFDVLGISIDDEKTKNVWKKYLIKHKLPWHQYLDENGLAKKLFINSIPANFLLDNNGKIVMRDFSMQELKEFLESNK